MPEVRLLLVVRPLDEIRREIDAVDEELADLARRVASGMGGVVTVRYEDDRGIADAMSDRAEVLDSGYSDAHARARPPRPWRRTPIVNGKKRCSRCPKPDE